MRVAQVTNASTTALFDLRRRTWDLWLMAALAISPSLCAPLDAPGALIGHLRDDALIAGDVETLRALVRATQGIRRYEPRAALARQGA